MSKNALIILAHPEQNSLNHSLMNESIKILEAKGYKVKTSDLYKMNFNPLLTSNDFKDWPANIPMNLMLAAGKSNESKKLSTDILEEQSKVEWADLVIFQFPLWWMSMPAILKGWFDRSISAKFAYGNKPQIPENSKLANKKAVLMITTAAGEEAFQKNGPHGDINDVLKPIQKTMLGSLGFQVQPPFCSLGCVSIDQERYNKIVSNLKMYLNAF